MASVGLLALIDDIATLLDDVTLMPAENYLLSGLSLRDL